MYIIEKDSIVFSKEIFSVTSMPLAFDVSYWEDHSKKSTLLENESSTSSMNLEVNCLTADLTTYQLSYFTLYKLLNLSNLSFSSVLNENYINRHKSMYLKD
jgi:hypothetical protein